jgi:hypothetical protein
MKKKRRQEERVGESRERVERREKRVEGEGEEERVGESTEGE